MQREQQHMKRKTFRIIIPIIVVLIIYLLLDYINVLSLIGITISNINVDAFGILFDATIVLILYTISFYYIENRQIEKDENARDTVDALLNKTYQECLSYLQLLDNREIIENYIIPKVDGNKPDSENKVVNNLQTLPFSSFNAVIDLAANGYVEKKKFDDYLDIKKEYQHLISLKITFFDLVYPQTDEQRAMYNNIKTRDCVLKTKLTRLINNNQRQKLREEL